MFELIKEFFRSAFGLSDKKPLEPFVILRNGHVGISVEEFARRTGATNSQIIDQLKKSKEDSSAGSTYTNYAAAIKSLSISRYDNSDTIIKITSNDGEILSLQVRLVDDEVMEIRQMSLLDEYGIATKIFWNGNLNDYDSQSHAQLTKETIVEQLDKFCPIPALRLGHIQEARHA